VKAYTKRFEEYYKQIESIPHLAPWQGDRVKRALFNAWLAGRTYQKTKASAYGDIVRWSS